MRKWILTGTLLLGLTGIAYAEDQCTEPNARLQAAVTEAQNSMIQRILLQSQISLLEGKLKALEEKVKTTNPKAESAAPTLPSPAAATPEGTPEIPPQ